MRWPKIHGPRRSTGAWEHAITAWNRAWTAACLQAGERGPGVRTRDLAFIGALAGHVTSCKVCGARWVEGDVPVDYLERALLASSSSVRDVWRAAVRQELALGKKPEKAA